MIWKRTYVYFFETLYRSVYILYNFCHTNNGVSQTLHISLLSSFKTLFHYFLACRPWHCPPRSGNFKCKWSIWRISIIFSITLRWALAIRVRLYWLPSTLLRFLFFIWSETDTILWEIILVLWLSDWLFLFVKVFDFNLDGGNKNDKGCP